MNDNPPPYIKDASTKSDATSVSPLIAISVFFDPICPWCYIGKRRLDQAIQLSPQYRFRKTYLPFQLNPSMPHQGMPRQDYLAAKFGGAEAAQASYAPVHSAAEELRLGFRLDSIRHTPNSVKAHILLQYLQQHSQNSADICDVLLEAIFRAYFCEGLDIGDEEVLANLWQASLGHRIADFAPLADIVGDDRYRQIVHASQSIAKRSGIGGVPFYLIAGAGVGLGEAGTYSLSGAQPAQAFLPLFELVEQAI